MMADLVMMNQVNTTFASTSSGPKCEREAPPGRGGGKRDKKWDDSN